MAKKVENLREALFDTIEALKEGKIDIEKAKTIAELGQVIINSAKAETDFLKLVTDPSYRKAAGSGFIPVNAGTLELPNPSPAESK